MNFGYCLNSTHEMNLGQKIPCIVFISKFLPTPERDLPDLLMTAVSLWWCNTDIHVLQWWSEC